MRAGRRCEAIHTRARLAHPFHSCPFVRLAAAAGSVLSAVIADFSPRREVLFFEDFFLRHLWGSDHAAISGLSVGCKSHSNEAGKNEGLCSVWANWGPPRKRIVRRGIWPDRRVTRTAFAARFPFHEDCPNDIILAFAQGCGCVG